MDEDWKLIESVLVFEIDVMGHLVGLEEIKRVLASNSTV